MFTKYKSTKNVWKLKMGAIREDAPISYVSKGKSGFSRLVKKSYISHCRLEFNNSRLIYPNHQKSEYYQNNLDISRTALSIAELSSLPKFSIAVYTESDI